MRDAFYQLASKRKSLVFIDFLAGIICLSMVMSICRFPLDFSFYRLRFASTMGQEDPFWFMEAGYIILQGLFFYRLFDFEITEKKDLKYFTPCLYGHAVIVTAFAFLQLIFNIPDQGRIGSVFSPFQNINVFGGYVLILFFFFLNLAFKRKKGIAVNWVLVMALSVCLFVSGNASALIIFFCFGLLFFVTNFGMQRFFFMGAGIVMVIILAANLNPSFFQKDKVPTQVKRYAERLNYTTALKKLSGRYYSLDQTLGMMKEHPLTGTGVGSFYRVSRHYHFSENAHPRRIENAHNYYFQFGAELGLPALLLFLSLLFVVLRPAIPFLGAHASSDIEYLNGLFFGVSAYLVTMLTNHHLILSNHQFLFWFALFGITSIVRFSTSGGNATETESYKRELKWFPAFLLLLFMMVAGGHAYNFFKGITPRGIYEYGYFEPQEINSDQMRWTMKQSCVELNAESDYMGVSFYTWPENFDQGNVTLDLFINDALFDTVLLDQPALVHKYYYVPGMAGKTMLFKIKADGSYNPYKKGLTDNIKESREQSAAVTDVQFFQIPLQGLKPVNLLTALSE